MRSLFYSIRHDTRANHEWHEVFLKALTDRQELGMFPTEFRNWFIDTGQDLDGRKIDPALPYEVRKGDEQVAEFQRVFQDVQRYFVGVGLLAFSMEQPDRVYNVDPTLRRRIGLIDEPCIRLTEKARRVAEWPRWRRVAHFGCLATITHTGPLRERLKKVAAAAGFVGGIARFVAGWETVHSIAAAAGAGALAAILTAVNN